MKIKVAILTGKHEYEVIQFQEMLRSLTGFEIYPQNLQDFVMDTPENRNSYSVIVFYNFHQVIPEDSNNYLVEFAQTILPELESSGKGFIFLHHALTAFPDWEYWASFCGLDPKRDPGLPDSRTNQIIKVKIKDDTHPITDGMSNWKITDEIYIWNDAAKDCSVLLETDHPDSMRTLAWTKNHGKSRVFSFQLGHDSLAYENENFQTLLSRGINWVCGNI